MEQIIIKLLFENKNYFGKVSPHLNPNYFDDTYNKIIIKHIMNFVRDFKSQPSYNEIKMSFSNDKNLNDKLMENLFQKLEEIETQKKEEYNLEYITKQTEHFFQEACLSKVILKGAEILQSPEKQTQKHALPQMMRDALKLSFDNTIGMVYTADDTIEKQYHFYHHRDHKYMFPNLVSFNNITRGGFAKKKIVVVQAGTGAGKTTFLCNFAKELLLSGCNVLYISLEISENDILERIDANILDVKTSDLVFYEKNKYVDKMTELRTSTTGRLIVKEYPTASANVNHFRILMDELEVKENFKADFIMIDYLNICSSTRYKNIGDTYVYAKAITEELRGLGVEKNVGIFTATQTNRSSWNSSDMELNQIAESAGTANTADLVIGVIENDELRLAEKYLLKVLKSRYAPITAKNQKFLIGIDKEKQKLYELDNPQEGLADEDLSTIKGQVPNAKTSIAINKKLAQSSWDEWQIDE